jgi:LPXTG-site transpeptidase (sortase) family protein
MNPTQKKIIGIGLTTLGVIFAGMVLVRSLYFAPDTDLTPGAVLGTATSSVAAGTIVQGAEPAGTAPKPSTSVLPSRLSIPRLGVDASIQHVGVKPSGQMANPSNFTDVGWYKDGTIPGQIGSAVMAGHVDNALALDGVFKELEALKPGDLVYVTRKNGERLTFKVDRLEYYHYKSAPNEEIFTSSDGKAHLNLVTCAGTWIKAERSYDQRLVVYTSLVE